MLGMDSRWAFQSCGKEHRGLSTNVSSAPVSSVLIACNFAIIDSLLSDAMGSLQWEAVLGQAKYEGLPKAHRYPEE